MRFAKPSAALLAETARNHAAVCYTLEYGDIDKAVRRFKASHPELCCHVRGSLTRFSRRCRTNGFGADRTGRLQHPASRGRPLVVRKSEGENMAKEMVHGYSQQRQQQYFHTR